MSDIEYKLIKQGAEAKLYRGKFLAKAVIIKERFKKSYRNQILDDQLNKERLKAEARALARCHKLGICVPALYMIDLTHKRIIMQDFENHITVKEYLESSFNYQGLQALATKIGQALRLIHMHHIIHGDLTPSNMLLEPSCASVVLIDFGLSFSGTSSEDKGVDLYVLEKSLLSDHPALQQFWTDVLNEYSHNNSQATEIKAKLDEVRLRGRKRSMIG